MVTVRPVFGSRIVITSAPTARNTSCVRESWRYGCDSESTAIRRKDDPVPVDALAHAELEEDGVKLRCERFSDTEGIRMPSSQEPLELATRFVFNDTATTERVSQFAS